MKKDYTKPVLNTKAYAQFENVFTACSKTKNGRQNDGGICLSGVVPHPDTLLDNSCAWGANGGS